MIGHLIFAFRRIRSVSLAAVAAVTVLLSPVNSFAFTARITIIMDDMGHNLALGRRAIALPGHITYAILPHTPGSVEFAEAAHKKGRDVILHAPMQSQRSRRLGPGGLTLDLKEKEFIKILSASIDAIPHVVGVNNHMGSLLTEHKQPMRWVMAALNERNLFFIDSRTSSRSVARKIAIKSTIPSLGRDVFLDHNNTPHEIEAAFDQLIRIAKWQGYAVGICHPYKNTLNFLEKAIPKLAQKNIRLISATEMIHGSNAFFKQGNLMKTVTSLPMPDVKHSSD